MALTVKRIEKLTKPGRYIDAHGLYLQVASPANRSWLLRYERAGRERWMGLGPTHTVDLADARDRARKARQMLLDGIDPLDARKAEREARALAVAKAITFEVAATAYFDAHESAWKPKHRDQFLSSMKAYAYPKIGRLSVAAIDTGLVLGCIEPIWKGKTVTANRVRSRIEAVLDWATARGYRTGDNPARWKGNLKHLLADRVKTAPTVEHHAAMPFGELPGFLVDLADRDGIAAKALEFVVLTAARTSEVTGARWEEFDLKAKTWTVPSERIKGGKAHRVPLSDRALAILTALPTEEGNEFVFVGSRRDGLSNMAMAAVLRRMGLDITVHGFRSTFRDWAAETTAFPNHVLEMALAHAIGGKVEAAYRRGDLFEKRRQLMAAWATYCSKPAPGSGEVVPIRGQR